MGYAYTELTFQSPCERTVPVPRDHQSWYWPPPSPSLSTGIVSVSKLHQWEFQDPKMEVLYHIRPYFGGISPYIGLTYGRYLQFRFLKWPLITSPIFFFNNWGPKGDAITTWSGTWGIVGMALDTRRAVGTWKTGDSMTQASMILIPDSIFLHTANLAFLNGERGCIPTLGQGAANVLLSWRVYNSLYHYLSRSLWAYVKSNKTLPPWQRQQFRLTIGLLSLHNSHETPT